MHKPTSKARDLCFLNAEKYAHAHFDKQGICSLHFSFADEAEVASNEAWFIIVDIYHIDDELGCSRQGPWAPFTVQGSHCQIVALLSLIVDAGVPARSATRFHSHSATDGVNVEPGHERTIGYMFLFDFHKSKLILLCWFAMKCNDVASLDRRKHTGLNRHLKHADINERKRESEI